MYFNSLVFAAFLAVVLGGYYLLSHRWQNRYLLLASYFFYAWWDWRFLGLLLISTVVDYAMALAMDGKENPSARRPFLWVSVLTNLGILGFFKYFDFFAESARELLSHFGMNPHPWTLSIALPMGIRFYTFQSMAYTIDVYRGHQKPVRSLPDFALYVSYFPQLVAGPIERATRLLPQIQNARRVGQADWNVGMQLILWGYLKKVAVADSLAPYVDYLFAEPGGQHALNLWIGVYAFALQIYCDFSGYSDIARGVSRLFGIELMINFRQPYFSRNIAEFWRRWHISLSTWLRDYLYFSLGGNRFGAWRQYRNMLVVMLLGGLWHGAAWTFVIWGLLHGVYLMVHRLAVGEGSVKSSRKPTTLREWLFHLSCAFATFHFVCIAWVFFRADSLLLAMEYIGGMVSPIFMDFSDLSLEVIPGLAPTLLFYAAVVWALDVACWRKDDEVPVKPEWAWYWRGLAYGIGFLIWTLVRDEASGSFIYFQF